MEWSKYREQLHLQNESIVGSDNNNKQDENLV